MTGVTCLQKNFLMIDDVREIVVTILQKYDHDSSSVVNNQKVFPYIDDTYYGVVPYCTLYNCKLFGNQFMAWNNFYATEMAIYGLSWRYMAD